jgi:hypothetical protein
MKDIPIRRCNGMGRRRASHKDAAGILGSLEAMHIEMRNSIIDSMRHQSEDVLRSADNSMPGDTIYGIDRISEALLIQIAEQYLCEWLPVTIVAEGLPDVGHGAGVATIPPKSSGLTSRLTIIVDPIDGTRGLMYGKRSAWILTGAAIGVGTDGQTPTVQDIDVAIQTEIPTPKQTFADTLTAIRGRGSSGTRTNLGNGHTQKFRLRPSVAKTILHGFGQVIRGIPGGRDVLGAVDDDVCRALAASSDDGKALTFEDQYISTGGQIGELVYGHDRWIADLRPLLKPVLLARGQASPLCCHPYDICTALIAEEAGAVVCDLRAEPIKAPLAVEPDVTWVGYANADIFSLVHPVLIAVIRRHGLLA